MDKSIYTREYAAVLDGLRAARRQAGLTQTELAVKIDETQSYVSKIERGELRLDLVELRTFCRALGLSVVAFVKRWERALADEN